MPTYEYACTSCGNEWEAEQSIKEDALKDCPKCKQDTARRQISRGGGFILKGGGWYSDLYSSSSNKKPDGDGGDKGASPVTPAAAGSSSSTSSDSASSASTPASPAPSAPAAPAAPAKPST